MTLIQLTLNEAFQNAFHKYNNRVAFNYNASATTYGELKEESYKIANALLKLNVENGTRVALLLPNTPEYVFCQMAIYQVGAVNVPLNDMLREADLEYILKDSESTVLIVDESFFQIISNIQNKLPHLKEIIGVSFDSQVPENFTDWFTFKNSGSTEQPKSTISPTELSQIVYTGGTTGYPKGVQHSHSSSMNALYSAIIDLEITEKDKLILNSP